MIKKISFLLVLLIQAFTLSALEVAVEEVNKAREYQQGIVFQNFTGRHQVTDTAAQIRNLGKALATMSTQPNRLYTISNKYSVVEVTNDQNDNLYSAAVISIDRSARVDHIRNVRQIVAGYLENKFNYSAQEADTLAFFLSFYNAYYRSNVEYLRTVYKPELFQFVNEQNAGLSTNYRDWPGNSRLIIPLAATSGVSLSHLGQDVIESAKQGDASLALEQRQNLQDLKSQQLSQTQQTQQQASEKEKELQSALTQKEAKAKSTRDFAAEKRAEADRLQAEADAAAAAGAPDAAEKAEKARKAREEADAAEQAAQQKEKETEQARQELQQHQQQSAQQQREIEQLQQQQAQEQQQLQQDQQAAQQAQQQQSAQQTQQGAQEQQDVQQQAQQGAQEQQAQQEQQDVQQQVQQQDVQQQAQQEQPQQTEVERLTQQAQENPAQVAQELANAREELDNRPPLPIVSDKFYYMSISNRQATGHYNNRIFAIDAGNGSVMGASASNICSVNYIAYAGGVLVVTARQGSHAGPHNLTVLSLDTLAVEKETDPSVDIHWNSPVILSGGKIYALVVENQEVFLARFDENLNLEVRTKTPVDGDTSITVYKDQVYANLSGLSKIVVLNKEDLSILNEITIPN